MLLVASVVSCTKVEYVTVTPEEETDLSTYTIMMYDSQHSGGVACWCYRPR